MNTLIAGLKEFLALEQEACGLLEELDVLMCDTGSYTDNEKEAQEMAIELSEAMSEFSDKYNEARSEDNVPLEVEYMVELVLAAAEYSLITGRPQQFAKAYPRMRKRAEVIGIDLRDMCSEEMLRASRD